MIGDVDAAAHDGWLFDPDELREKYRRERDRRMRADGNAQYIGIDGKFAHFLADPYVAPLERAPIEDDTEIIVIGGGFGGLLAGARLRDAGFKDIRLIEKGGDFGGTWYWNRYPNAACDVESYIYLPLLEELDFMPRRKYTPAAEILAHCRRIAEHYGLYDKALLQTEVTGMHWHAEHRRWLITTHRGDRLWAKFVAMANGPAHRPKLPGIPGIETFKGHTFHTSRWDYGYTGGGPEGGLTKLANKRVGVIGTGATAVQCIPPLGEWAARLYVFQRTPSSVDVRDDYLTDPDWYSSLKPGWQRERMANFSAVLAGEPVDVDLVSDGWTDATVRYLRTVLRGGNPEAALSPEALELADFAKMEQIRARVEQNVQDPKVAELLKPYYRQFCKRPCFHDDYLPTFNRDNVTLVDTSESCGVERITERAVVVKGVEYEVDCLIFASGFETTSSYTRRAGYDVHGVDGLALSEKWSSGVSSLHGVHVRGFPNLFFIQYMQAALPANFTQLLEEQSRHIAYIVREVVERGATRVEASEQAESDWVRTIIEQSELNLEFLKSCTPGYYNGEGQITDLARRASSYGSGPSAYFKLTEQWREKGDLAGLELG
jgi:cyclohexanone monooxygenase